MLNNIQIQSALISYLKSNAAILEHVPAVEVREVQWQGNEFTYPNIRVRISSNRPLETNCDVSDANFSILVFSELDSSIEADRIAGIINVALHTRSFSSDGVRFSMWGTNLIPAIRIDTRTWRSEILMHGTVTG